MKNREIEIKCFNINNWSATVNLPEVTTVNEVKDLYLQAWKQGLKGITIYRSGSKNPILSTTGFNTPQEFYRSAPKRPKTLKADFYKVKADGKPFGVFIGLFEDKPYEVFALPLNNFDAFPNKVQGTITKLKKRIYEFKSKVFGFENIALDPEDFKEWRNTTLHVSAMLRHGMRIEDIMKIEDKCNDVVTSFNKAIWKVLSNYAKNTDLEERCPECGGELIRENGCKHCKDCEYSACYFTFAYEN